MKGKDKCEEIEFCANEVHIKRIKTDAQHNFVFDTTDVHLVANKKIEELVKIAEKVIENAEKTKSRRN